MTLLQKIIITGSLLSASCLIAWILHRVFLRSKTRTWNDILSDSLSRVLPYITILIAAYLSVYIWDLPLEQNKMAHKFLLALAIVAATFILASLGTSVIKIYGRRGTHAIAATTLARNMANALILIIGLLVLLHHFGIAIAPMLTAMGIGGIAIALGLQDTLSNVFAGIYIIWAGRMKIGDYIKLSSGEEGYVHDIAWRETRLKTSAENILTIPNNLIAKSSMTNCSTPSKEIGFSFYVAIDYSSDLEYVENVTLEEAQNVLKSLLTSKNGFEPTVRYEEFNDSSISLKINLRADDQNSQKLIIHQFIKNLHHRYRKENIIIPFPIRTIIHNNNGEKILD